MYLYLQLLNKDQRKRFGCTGDQEEIQAHPWFKELDFKRLEAKEVYQFNYLKKKYLIQIAPPFKPKIDKDNWINNFDEEFTKEGKK